MKKFIKIMFLTFIVMFLTTIKVNAAGFSTYLSGNTSINEKSTFTITVGVRNASNLWGFRAPINYDHSKLTLVNSTGLNGFGIAVGQNFVADSSNGKNGTVKVATLTFKAVNLKVGERTTISLGTAEGSNGETTFTGSPSSIKVQVQAPKNNNNNLRNLSIEGYDIGFNKDKTNYSIIVNHDIEKININATSDFSKAKVNGLGEKSLNLYSNIFDITVTAENGSTKVYKIEVIRKDIDGNIKELSKDNFLKTLEIKDYNIAFNKDINEYTILLKNDKKLDIKVESNNENATVTIDNIDKYKKGNNIIKVRVVAENGEEKIYKINAIKLEENKKESNNSLYIIIAVETLLIILGTIYAIYKKYIKKVKNKK